MQELKLAEAYTDCPTTTRTEEIKGKKYIVVSHYVGSKDFKQIFSELAFKQVYAQLHNKK